MAHLVPILASCNYHKKEDAQQHTIVVSLVRTKARHLTWFSHNSKNFSSALCLAGRRPPEPHLGTTEPDDLAARPGCG